MNTVAVVIVLFALGLGVLIGWLASRIKAARTEATLIAERDAERRLAEQRGSLLELAERRMRETFADVSRNALRDNSDALLQLAESKFGELTRSATADIANRQQSIDDLVRPVHDDLDKVKAVLQKLDVDRASTKTAIESQLKQVAVQGTELATQAQMLVQALRKPSVRGRWGEMQLRRVVELAGMQKHCDFVEQETTENDEGRRLRPDLHVRIPGEKLVVVDSKVPLDAFMDSTEAKTDVERNEALDRHVRQLRTHIDALASKEYGKHLPEAPDFVVLFVPGEHFLSAACERDPELLEYAVNRGVIPGSPTTLITLLKAVAFGWQQEKLAQNSEQIRDLGRQLYERVGKLAGHFAKVGSCIRKAVEAYNAALGSLESRFLPTARRLADLGVTADEEIETVDPIDIAPRLTTIPEENASPPRLERAG